MASDDEDDDGSLRACDSCRLKKIKCDKKDPCGSCSTRQINCLRTMPDARKRKRRNSETLASDVQARLDQMQSQLDKIMSVLATTRPTATPYSPPRPENGVVSTASQSMTQVSLPASSYSAFLTDTEPRAKYKSIVPSFEVQGKRRAESQSDALPGNFASVKLLNSLVTNIKGQLQHLGKSSLLSMSIEAQLLSTALHDDRDTPDEMNCMSSVTDLEDEVDYEKDAVTVSETVKLQQGYDSGMRDARGSFEDLQGKKTDLTVHPCPAMKSLLYASLDYVASNFLPVNWVEELDIRDHVPILPPKTQARELIDYYIEFVLPFEQMYSQAFVQVLLEDIYRPETPDRLQKIVCVSYMMIIVLFWPEREVQEADICLREKLLKNIWLILKEPSVFITASFINVQTLLLAATAAERIYHPGLCWMLISQCSRLALTLGLHRQSAIYFERELSPVEIEERRLIFWRCYVTEKSLSLTLGRASSLPMFDCDVQHNRNTPSCGNETESQKRHRFGARRANAVESFAEVYDAVYVRLYSARAQQQSASDKRNAVRELDAMLRKVWQDVHPWIVESQMSGIPIYSPMTANAEFMYYVCMTMIHRLSKGIMDNEGGESTDLIDTADGWRHSTDIALASARSAILVIQRGLSEVASEVWSRCLATWSLIFQPFAPFFELFTSVIKTGYRDDLQLMRIITGILKNIKTPPESVRKLTHVAELFTRLATMAVLAIEKKLVGSQKSSMAPASTAGTAFPTPLSMSRLSPSGPLSSEAVGDGLTSPLESPPNPAANTSLCRQTSVSGPAIQFPLSDGSSSDAASQQPAPAYVSDHEIEAFLLGGTVTQDLDLSSIKWLLRDPSDNPLNAHDFDLTTLDANHFAPVDYTIPHVDQQPILSQQILMPRI
ncbi:hypothetical protein V1509DRAFT_627866 [Lipomyces kononenkoae]